MRLRRLVNAAARIGATRLGAWLLARATRHLDPLLLRLTGGRWFVPSLAGLSPILLSTRGAQTGRRRTVPLAGIRDGDRLILVASNFGRRRYPGWYYNLRAQPEAEVTVRGRTRSYVAHEAAGQERERLWRLIAADYPTYESYRRRVAAWRRVPLIVLQPAPEKTVHPPPARWPYHAAHGEWRRPEQRSAAMKLNLTPDELLTTTRSVRKRLDLERPVAREVIEECIRIAQQAPTGSNSQRWGFVVVTDPDKRRGLAELYRKGWEAYTGSRPLNPNAEEYRQPDRDQTQARVRDSSTYLAQHMAEVPVLVVPCTTPRTDDAPAAGQAAIWGGIIPATWSFMLAARERGLGTVYTTLHLPHEREAAVLLGIPYDQVMQAALIPVAYTRGTDFQPAKREPVETMIYWNAW